MPGQHRQRRYQRFDPSTAWMVRGSDPAAGTSPDPLSSRTVRRRRGGPVRALLRGMLPWLLPLLVLAALPRILSMLAGH
jgi:hypothetical protein